MKTLIVKYLPSGEKSNTKQVLDIFLEATKNQQIETLDILKTEVPIFNEASIQAYYKRNYGGQKLDSNEAKLLEKNDKLIAQFKSADVIIFACPMHNFGFPGIVKSYMDAVIFNGETFAYDKKMMAGKKVLTLFTSGGFYSNDTFNFSYPNWNTIALLASAAFGYIGFDEVKTIGTSLRDEKTKEKNLSEVKNQITEIVSKWYK